jgi:hypothetical protein
MAFVALCKSNDVVLETTIMRGIFRNQLGKHYNFKEFFLINILYLFAIHDLTKKLINYR